MRIRNKITPQEGSLLALPLEDGTWGLGQVLKMDFIVDSAGVTWCTDFEVAAYKHVRVKHPKEIDGESIPLRREDIVFIFTNHYGSISCNEYLVLPFVRETNVAFHEMTQYERRKDNPNASAGTEAGADSKLSSYFGLRPWFAEIYENPEYNSAIKINPNLRPPDAKLWVRPDPKDRISILCFYLYFKTAKGRDEFIEAVKPLGYNLLNKIPANRAAGIKAGVILKTNLDLESQDEYEEQLAPIAKQFGGFYDGMEQVWAYADSQ